MQVLSSLRRIRARLHALERGVKTLRSEVDSALLAFDDDTGLDLNRVDCGLSRLLSSRSDIPLTETQPYSEFAPGVWCSVDQRAAGTNLLVAARTLSRMDPLAQDGHMSRICVHPVYTTTEKPLWCTLEFTIDAEAFKAAPAIRIDFSCFFDVPPGATVPLPATTKLQLRLRQGEETRDAVERHFPITTMSFDHSLDLPAKAMSEMELEDVTGVVGIVTLPQSGNFTFNVERFNIYAVNG